MTLNSLIVSRCLQLKKKKNQDSITIFLAHTIFGNKFESIIYIFTYHRHQVESFNVVCVWLCCCVVVYRVPHLILIRCGEHEESVCGTVDGLILSACVLALFCTVLQKKWLGPKQITFIIPLCCCECQLFVSLFYEFETIREVKKPLLWLNSSFLNPECWLHMRGQEGWQSCLRPGCCRIKHLLCVGSKIGT